MGHVQKLQTKEAILQPFVVDEKRSFDRTRFDKKDLHQFSSLRNANLGQKAFLNQVLPTLRSAFHICNNLRG
jgi:hypothetical protein